jgi:UDP-N-acetylmuramate--alanine ligase
MIQRRRPVPFELGPVHFIGIGGIGMSGIAEIMIRIGYTVQGSDAKSSANTERLEKLGARIFIGQDGANVEGASAIVYSTAIKPDNVEMAAGRDKRLPLVRRAEMLAELMRLQFSIAVGGTHGKTTTTSMVAALLDAGALDPTVVNGGIINAYGTNAKVGEGDWIVVEADESDGSFLKLKSTVAIVTNIDAEHLDHWGDVRRGQEGLPGLHREHPVLRLRGGLHRPPRSPGPDLAHREPPPGDLRRPTRRPRSASATSRWAPRAASSTSWSRRATARRSAMRA